jgi:ABC-type sugar transport system ATPase subunit
LAEQGAAIIYITSEILETLHLCHRVMVMHSNTIGRIISRAEATEEKILSACFGYAYHERSEPSTKQFSVE